MSDTELLVIGAGPVGLTLACEARRHGADVRIIDEGDGPSVHSKAQIVHVRTLELLDDMGIADRFVERGGYVHTFNVFSEGGAERLVQLVIGDVDSAYHGFLSLSQHHTETLLEERLVELGGEVEWGVRLASFEQDGEGVTATIERDGETETLRARYLVGCDGAHSTVRRALDVAFEGEQYPMCLIQSDARVDFPFPQHDDEVLAFLSPKAIAGFFPLPGEENRYRFLVPLGGGSNEELEPGAGEHIAEMKNVPTIERFQEILDMVAPPGSKVSDPKWIVGFRIHCRLAERFRDGHVFLAGDAAHIHSPAGGQGMNMGMHDAYNLAWKLALVLKGEGTAALLDSYEAERRPVAAETLGWTDRATKGAVINFGVKNKMAVAARNRVAGFIGSLGLVQQRMSRMMSMIDVTYRDSPICGQHRHSVLTANVTQEASSEAPSVASWATFGGGPKPGTRAPDAYVDPGDHDSPRLFEHLQGTSHNLLLFDGAAATPEGYENLASIANRVRARFGHRVRVHVVVPRVERPDGLGELPVIHDLHGAFHAAYGAETECLYVVRPDGYVGFRGQPAEGDPVMTHLELVLT